MIMESIEGFSCAKLLSPKEIRIEIRIEQK
jgi:hypothetical protein